MQKVFKFLNEKRNDYLSCGIGAYLMMILVDLLTSPSKDLFLTLSPISLLKLGVFVITAVLLVFVPLKVSFLNMRKINILLSSLVLMVAIFKSMSFFLALGLLFLTLILFTGTFLSNQKYSNLYLLVVFLLFNLVSSNVYSPKIDSNNK